MRLPDTTLWHSNDNIRSVFQLFRSIVHAMEAERSMIIDVERLYGLAKAPAIIDSDEE